MDDSALALQPQEGAIPPGIPVRNQPPLLPQRRETARGRGATGRDLAVAGIAHDARNLVTALRLCSDLLAEPGVLAEGQEHFSGQMHALAEAADYIVRRLSSLTRMATLASQTISEEVLIEDLALAVRQLASLLAAVAGPAIEVEIVDLPCPGALSLSEENLSRILLNLVRNAADAMSGGRIRITTQTGAGRMTTPSGSMAGAVNEETEPALPIRRILTPTVLLAVEDDGPGIPSHLTEVIFDPGFSTRHSSGPWPQAPHHGLGLSIVREITEAAGGTIRALARPAGGARFELEFPLTNVTSPLPLAGSPTGQSLSE